MFSKGLEKVTRGDGGSFTGGGSGSEQDSSKTQSRGLSFFVFLVVFFFLNFGRKLSQS